MEERIAVLQRALPADIDGALITSQINRRYYTGLSSSAGTLLVTRGDAVLLIDFRYIEAAKAMAANSDYRVLLQTNQREQISELMQKWGLSCIAVENGRMTLEAARRMEESIQPAKLCTDDRLEQLIRTQRQIKSAEEIARISEAQRLSEEAFLSILPTVRAGRTEAELALELEFSTRRLGSEGSPFEFIVVGGPNSSRPHGRPGSRPLQQGDMVTFDFGSTLDGYCSDMTRTVAVGPPDALAREIYEVTLQAQLAALADIRPGVECAQIDRAAREIIESAGYGQQFGHSTGHSVGLEIHEFPNFAATSQDICRAGMVLSVEPGIYIEGKCGCRIEDLICITQNGCRNLNSSPKELLIL